MTLEQPQAIRTIFFDAGFTLLTSSRSTPEICQQVAHTLGLHLHLEAVEQRMYEAEEYFQQQTRAYRHTWGSEDAITAFWIGYYVNLLRPVVEEHDEARLRQLASAIQYEYEQHTSWTPYPDVIPTLEILRARNYSLGVISDWGIALGPILQNLNLSRYFDTLLVSATTRYGKPSPALYEAALQRANAIADYTLHIGDSYVNDVLGARSVGMVPVLLDRHHQVQASDVDCILVHSLYELLDILEVPRA